MTSGIKPSHGMILTGIIRNHEPSPFFLLWCLLFEDRKGQRYAERIDCQERGNPFWDVAMRWVHGEEIAGEPGVVLFANKGVSKVRGS